jgi:glycosyltransferase involved in cell wall biosynthesis
MKIWLLTSEFPPLFGGGISTYCLESAKMFSSSGHDISIITPDPNAKKIRVENKDTYKVVYFNPENYYTSTFLGHEANLSFAFSQAVKEYTSTDGIPDIIEAQEYMGIAYYMLQFKQLRYPVFKDLKILVTLHAPSFLYLEFNKVSVYQHPYFWIGEMEKFCIRAADMVVSPSAFLVNELKSRMKLDDIEIHIIKNPFAVNWNFQDSQVKKNKIVFFGKLIPQKGCLELIEFFKQGWKKGNPSTLYMIGGGNHLYHPEGMDMDDFINKKYKEEIKAGRLKLLGAIEPGKIKAHIADAHIIVIPSTVDNLPYTVLEAMANGKIVLASVQGGQSEIIIDQQNGFLFDYTNPDSFETKLQEILSLNDDQRKNIEKQAFLDTSKLFAYETIYDVKIKLLERLNTVIVNNHQFPFTRLFNPVNASINIEINGLLSIVIPYYNMGRYIHETLDSIHKSTYKNIEIIIVNDGSTEQKSIEVLNEFKGQLAVKIIHKKNEGLASARNMGAAHATGEFIAILDPDDTIEATYYEKAIQVLKQYTNVHFVGCWAAYFGEAKGYWPAFTPEPPYLLVHNMINSSALVYKSKAFLNGGQNDKRMIYGMEDYESVINLVKNGYYGVVLPEPLWNYRIRKDSMARAFTKEKQIYLYRLIADKHSDFYSIFASQIANLLNANGPGINYDNPTVIYKVPYNKWINLKLKQFIIKKIKSNPTIRKLVIRVIKFLQK